MTSDSQNLFKITIERKRRELMDEIRLHSAGLSITESENDPTDQVQSMLRRDQSAGLVVRLSDTLAKVDRSLESIADGTFGLCVECDGEIGPARLRAIPWASHCIRCQQLLESSDFSDFRPRTAYVIEQRAA